MEDLIKRSDATEVVYKALRTPPLKGVLTDTMSLAIALVRDIPTADRPQGEWIEHKERTIVRDNNFIDFFPTEYECSNCGLREAHYFINSKPHNFCPNCGCRMKGAGDESVDSN